MSATPSTSSSMPLLYSNRTCLLKKIDALRVGYIPVMAEGDGHHDGERGLAASDALERGGARLGKIFEGDVDQVLAGLPAGLGGVARGAALGPDLILDRGGRIGVGRQAVAHASRGLGLSRARRQEQAQGGGERSRGEGAHG